MAFLCLVVALAAAPEYVDVYVSKEPTAGVFLTDNEVEVLRARMTQNADFEARAEELIQQADKYLAVSPNIPPEGGAWLMTYTCPEHGGYLRYTEGKHRCPVDGETFEGPKIEAGYRAFVHENNGRQCETLGWAYALTGNTAYAERVHDILTAYAGFYGELPRQREGDEGGRIMWQTLTEAITLLRFCVGYDRTRAIAPYTEATRGQIESHLLLPMVETIRPNMRPQSNWQAWHNSAIGCAGYLLKNGDLVDWAVNGEAGFLFQRENCIKASGIWHEESPTYHLFALEPYVYLFEAVLRADSNLYDDRVELFFDAPLRYLLPDFTFPPLHNSDRGNIRTYSHLYEVAYRRFEDATYLPILGKRTSALALVWGVEEIAASENAALHLESMTMPEDGLAVLRNETDTMAAFLDFSGEGSVHTHPAKLGLLLFAHGDIRFVDPGRISYNHPLQNAWYAQTIAHNAPVIDATSQDAATGQITAFAATDAFRVLRASCDGAYPTVSMDRTLAQRGNVWIDVVQIFGGTLLQVDLPLHVEGEFVGLPSPTPGGPLGDKDGYQFLEDIEHLGPAAFTCTLRTGEGKGIHITIADPAGETFTALAPGYVPTDRLPMLLRRQKDRHARFVSVYEVFEGEDAPPTPVEVQHAHPLAVRVGDFALELGSTTTIHAEGASHYIGVNGITGSRALTAAPKDVALQTP